MLDNTFNKLLTEEMGIIRNVQTDTMVIADKIKHSIKNTASSPTSFDMTTYKNGIINAPCIIAKSSNRFNMYLNDPSYKCYQNNYVFIRNFSNGFPIEQSHYVLTVMGDKIDQA